MFKKILVNLHAEIELPRSRWVQNLEEQAKHLEHEAKDLTDFLHDHRSRDGYDVRIIREFKSKCEFCGLEEERDENGCPVCCDKAIEEFEEVKVK